MRNKPNDHGVIQLRRTIYCSLCGLLVSWQEESSFRKMVMLFILLIPASFLVPSLTVLERMLLILPLGIGLIVELLNSAIENVVDLVTQEIHPLARKAKDMGSAAQLINIIMLVAVWVLVLGSKFR